MTKRVVVLGGGTGTSSVLRSLKHFDVELTAIVSTADDGGSSGRLREEYDIIPVGDIRQCLLALSNILDVEKRAMEFRYDEGNLKGHAVGNIMLANFLRAAPNVMEAMRVAENFLQVKGHVIPVTNEPIVLGIRRKSDGKEIIGEHVIDEAEIVGEWDAFFDPANPVVIHEAMAAIRDADAVILGPGSFYTSLLAVLVPEICDAIRQSKARCIFNVNLESSVRQNAEWTMMDFVRKIEKILGRRFDTILVDESLKEGEDDRIRRCDLISMVPVEKVRGDVVERSMVRHDEEQLGDALWNIIATL